MSRATPDESRDRVRASTARDLRVAEGEGGRKIAPFVRRDVSLEKNGPPDTPCIAPGLKISLEMNNGRRDSRQ
jgi:hypothetical protein